MKTPVALDCEPVITPQHRFVTPGGQQLSGWFKNIVVAIYTPFVRVSLLMAMLSFIC